MSKNYHRKLWGEIITGNYEEKLSQEIMRRNYHRNLWGEISTGNYDEKLSQEIMRRNYHKKLWGEIITGNYQLEYVYHHAKNMGIIGILAYPKFTLTSFWSSIIFYASINWSAEKIWR